MLDRIFTLLGQIFVPIRQFLALAACVVPLAFIIGAILGAPLTWLLEKLIHRPVSSAGSEKKKYELDWPWWLVISFLTGVAAFPLSKLILDTPWTLWSYLMVFASLGIFAIFTPVMAGEALQGKNPATIMHNLYALWGGLAGGGLAGALLKWFWI